MMILSLVACSNPIKPIEVSTKPVDKPTLVLPAVDELNMREVKWVVINEANVEEVIADFKKRGKPFAVYALTGDGYGNLGLNFSDIRALVQQQQAIIAAYDGYYKAAEEKLDNAVTID